MLFRHFQHTLFSISLSARAELNSTPVLLNKIQLTMLFWMAPGLEIVEITIVGLFTVTVYCTGVLRGLTVPSPYRNAPPDMLTVRDGSKTSRIRVQSVSPYHGSFLNDMYEIL